MASRTEDRQNAFDPNARAVKLWDQALLLCLFLEAFVLPYFLAFQPEVVGVISTFFVVVIACDFVFAVDLFVQAHMGYYSDGNLIRNKKRTIRRYVRSQRFAMDFIAIVPTQVVVLGYPQLVNELLFLKLIRWWRLPHLVSSVDEFYAKHFVVLKLLKVLVSTVYLAHVLACVRYSFGEDESHEDLWLPSNLSHNGSLRRDYLISLFWSVGIMTGLFEGELPCHSSEFLFTILVSLCGFSMFTTLCATIFVISKCESGNTEAMSARINQLIHVLSFHHVPEAQQIQAIEYLKRYYTDAESTDRETAKILCPSIANDIQVELLKSTLAQISLFAGYNDQFIVAMTSLLELTAVPAQTTLFSEGHHGNAMYVVRSGVLAVIARSVTVLEMRKGTCFGELFVFSSMSCTATVISTTYSILYKLSRFHCERVLEGYPDCASVIAVHVKDILRQMNISEDEGSSNTSFNSISSRSDSRKAALRRASITTGGITRALARARRGSSLLSPQRMSISRKKSKRNSIGPLLQDLQPGNKPTSSEHLSRDMKSDTTMSAEDVLSHTLPMKNEQESITFDHGQRSKLKLVYKHHGLWRLVLLQRCIDFHSPVRMWWLLLLFSNLCYCWIMIPVQVIFPLWQHPSWVTQSIDTISNIGLLLDLVLNLNLSHMVESDKVMDPMLSARRYLRTGFLFDVLCALPYEYLCIGKYGLLRLPRLVRVIHLKRHLKESDQFIQLNSRRQLMLLVILFFIMFHVVACIYFGISYYEGFDPNKNEAWVCPTSLCLRRLNATHLENCNGIVFDERLKRKELEEITTLEYFRSLYYSVGVLASPGKRVEPTSDFQLTAALILMLSGFLISGIVVDNVQKRFTASAFEQKQFFETSTRIQLFLRRQKAPLAIHHRVKFFLDYWWSSHRGAVIRELLADLPRSMRLELLRSICTPVLQTLALLQGVHPVRDKLEEVMVENASFILYGQGETVYRHGDYVTGMFFVLEGEVCVVKMGGAPSKIHRGGYFGTATLTQQERGEGYMEHVSANSGCILIFISREHLRAMEAIFPPLKTELLTVDRKFMSGALASLHVHSNNDEHSHMKSMLHIVRFGLRNIFTTVYDPDSLFTLTWETWLFMVMTVQWVLVMFQACFPLKGAHKKVDSLMVFLEISFLLDVFIRSRLGFYEYGNKVMDMYRIKQQYFRSGTFALDIVALLPLYAVNWGIASYKRWDLLNINKLLRLFKVPKQLHALETRYLKRTTELHLFKLLYYTFMLSHILGCIWFSFASGVAIPNFGGNSFPNSNQTAFGENPWLPAKRLEDGTLTLQYMASLYWSFGLMSSSGESEYPQTTAQCIFSVVTMTAGVFLFAYVIGNFTDIIELTSSESREFNVKMGAARHMLDHFKIPVTLQERVKTFLLFKRYHTITQEHLLGECLPPSLLTDIRLVYLKPMIEKVDFLADMEISITRMLVSQFTQVLVSRGEFVFRFGDCGSDMFFVFTGILDVLLPQVAKRIRPTFRLIAETIATKASNVENTQPQAGPTGDDLDSSWQQNTIPGQLKKMNEISAGRYFGENRLFTNSERDAYIQARTSCILYRLSRESLELVFERYPKWKEKVIHIANIHREQARLEQLSRDEQRRGTLVGGGRTISRSDIINERVESLKGARYKTHLQRSNTGSSNRVSPMMVSVVKQQAPNPLRQVLDGFIHGVPVQSKFHHFWLRFIIMCTMFGAIMIPYQLTMDAMNRTTVVPTLVNVIGILCEVAFVVDLWFSWHVHESQASMELYDQKLRSVYKKERMLWDVLAAIPFYGVLAVLGCSPWFKLLRCVKILNLGDYFNELNRRSIENETTSFWHV
ncbi:unnamed protein product [Phytophthora fragariaefolia]|uniref:Unnamed protein product n=1 Tax=Phytophthora fragariaefolia TaxID=1490495 RepID=A0A9W6XN39_9STRA|nr:unnamed protein product [Phytophthora fragariaefolia]